MSKLPCYERVENKMSDALDHEIVNGCLIVKKTRNEAVRVYHFGQISKEDRIRQSEVDAVYGMDLN